MRLSEKQLKPYEKFFIPNYHFCRTGIFPGRKGGTALAVRRGISHNHTELPPLAPEDTVRECISIDKGGGLFAAVCKSAGNNWNDESHQ
jgi:hypothetical protein